MREGKPPYGIASDDGIRAALDDVRSRIAEAEAQRAQLDRVIANGKEEERLLQRLLALRSGDELPSAEKPVSLLDQRDSSILSSGSVAVDAVVTELGSIGRPVHISELMRLLRERSVQIPGAGTQANLIAHLRRDARIVRPSRGMYGLSSWGLESMAAPKFRRRRTRKRRHIVRGLGHDH